MPNVHSGEVRSNPKKRHRPGVGDPNRGDSRQLQQTGSNLFSIRNAALLAVGLGALGLATRAYTRSKVSQGALPEGKTESSASKVKAPPSTPEVRSVTALSKVPSVAALPMVQPPLPGIEELPSPEVQQVALSKNFSPTREEPQETPEEEIFQETQNQTSQSEAEELKSSDEREEFKALESAKELARKQLVIFLQEQDLLLPKRIIKTYKNLINETREWVAAKTHLYINPPTKVGILQMRAGEDTFGAIPMIYDESRSFTSGSGGVYFVADGHAGGNVQILVRNFAGPLLYEIITDHDFPNLSEEQIKILIDKVFEQTEEFLRDLYVKNDVSSTGGSTFVGFIYLGRRVAFFNIGDGVTGVLDNSGWKWKSSEHNKGNPQEVQRAERMGGWNDELALTRSLGDFSKKERSPGVIRIADIKVLTITPGDKLIAATDGITDAINVEDIPRLVNEGSDLITVGFDLLVKKIEAQTARYFNALWFFEDVERYITNTGIERTRKNFTEVLFMKDVDDMTYVVVEPEI